MSFGFVIKILSSVKPPKNTCLAQLYMYLVLPHWIEQRGGITLSRTQDMPKISIQSPSLGGLGLGLSQISVLKIFRYFKSKGETMVCMMALFFSKKPYLQGVNLPSKMTILSLKTSYEALYLR